MVMAMQSNKQVTMNDGVPGEKDEVMSESEGMVVKEPDGGTKVRMAKKALVMVRTEGGNERRTMIMARVSSIGEFVKTVKADGSMLALSWVTESLPVPSGLR